MPVVCLLALPVMIAGCSGSNGNANDASAHVSAEGVEAAMQAAEEYLSSREYTNAQAILETLLAKKPDYVEGWEALGQVLFSQAIQAQGEGREKDAAVLRLAAYESYARAVELQPGSAGLQHSAGIMALSADMDEEAVRHFAAAGALDPDNVQHPLYEAQVHLKHGRLDDAEAALERAHAIDEDEPFTISSMAIVAMEREDYDRAIELIVQARAIDPRSLGFRAQEARIRRRAGQPREAIDLLQHLPLSERAQHGIASELATCYELIGDYARAAAAWSARWESAQDDWQAALHAAEAHMRAGDQTAAGMMFDAARQIAPNEPEVKAFGESLAARRNK